MKKALLLLVLLTGCSACAGKASQLTEAPMPVDTSAVMRLMGRWASAHACPVDGLVLTAAHALDPFYRIPIVGERPIGYAWSDMAGNRGLAIGVASNLHRDFGVMRSTLGTPLFYRHAIEEPKPGEAFQWVEYDFDSKENAYAPKHMSAVLVRRLAGHLILDPVPTRGASGTCVFNSRSEVAGIIVRGVRVGVDGESVGVAVSVSGPWWPEKAPGVN